MIDDNGKSPLTLTLQKVSTNSNSYSLALDRNTDYPAIRPMFAPPVLTNNGSISALSIEGFNSFWTNGNIFIRATSAGASFRAPLPYFRPAAFRAFDPQGATVARGSTVEIDARLFNSYPGSVARSLTNLPPGFSYSFGGRQDFGSEAKQRLIISVPTEATPEILMVTGVAVQGGVSREFSFGLNITAP